MTRPTNFVRACRQIESALIASTKNGSGGHKRRARLQHELALWATTDYASDAYGELSTLKLPWKRWDTELFRAGLHVAAALRMMAVDGSSLAKARAYLKVPDADLREVLRLIKSAGLSIHEVVRQQNPEVNTLLTSARERVHVRLEPRALEDMLLAAAEGYKVSPGKGFKYTEVFGLCFGSVRRKNNRSVTKDVFVNVGRVATQMRAKASANEVMPNSKSLAAQLHVGDQFFPHLEVVGDYHTHPYRSLVELKAHQGWLYSDQDSRSLPDFLDEILAHKHEQPIFSLVVAVASGGKSGKGSLRRGPNVIQVSVGDMYFVIGAYRIRLDGTYDDHVNLSLSALVS